jgi:hypothetical protein
MIRAPKHYPNVAALAGLLRRLGAVDRASMMKVEARTPVERAFSMPIERREQMQPCPAAFELPGGYLRVLIRY